MATPSSSGKTNDAFEPIPGYGDRYEISTKGVVRNRFTKKKLKLQPNGCYRLWDDVHIKDRSKTSLIYEVYDVDKRQCAPAVPVILSKGRCREYFETLTEASEYLATILPLTFDGVRRYFKMRRQEIYGWTVKYMHDIKDNYSKELNSLARRQRRAVS